MVVCLLSSIQEASDRPKVSCPGNFLQDRYWTPLTLAGSFKRRSRSELSEEILFPFQFRRISNDPAASNHNLAVIEHGGLARCDRALRLVECHQHFVVA